MAGEARKSCSAGTGAETRRASAFDVAVGQRLKLRRSMLGITQEQLAESIGVSWQQLQKYEAGTNRISAARLANIATTLRTDVRWLLRQEESPSGACSGSGPSHETSAGAVVTQQEIAELLGLFCGVVDHNERRKIIEIVRTLADVRPQWGRVGGTEPD